LACAGCTIYRSIVVSKVKKGGWLAIVGSGGGLGHLGLQMAKAKSINVIGVDTRDEGIELSKKSWVPTRFDARKEKAAVVKEVQALTEGLGVGTAINTSEHETAAPLSCAITRIHGRMVQVAQPDMVCVPFPELIFRDIRIVGTLTSGTRAKQRIC
jgi:propanol-preferring alcohol dehydrogenase